MTRRARIEYSAFQTAALAWEELGWIVLRGLESHVGVAQDKTQRGTESGGGGEVYGRESRAEQSRGEVGGGGEERGERRQEGGGRSSSKAQL